MNKALTKADIVEAVYNDKNLGRNRAEVKNIVENLLALMKQAIKKDDALLISGFGKFEAYDKTPARDATPRPMNPSRCLRAKWWCSAFPASSAWSSTAAKKRSLKGGVPCKKGLLRQAFFRI